MEKSKCVVLQKEAHEIRKTILSLIVAAHASHIASAYSCVELLVYLYDSILKIDPKNPHNQDRDRFILSKGWGVSALYCILQKKGFISKTLLHEYCKDGSKMIGIATRNGIPGIETTTGSMGHGLPIGVGIAKAMRLQKRKSKVYVMISDGELDEGSTWEAILVAAHHKLHNLIVIVDYNKWQSFGKTNEVLNLEPLLKKWQSWNWYVQEINGHNFLEIKKAFNLVLREKEKPSVIISHTIKGKGLSIIENNNDWHYKTPTSVELAIAKKEGLI